MLFHKDLGLPKGLSLPKGNIFLEYSRHAQQAAKDDRYGRMILPAIINLDEFEVIEVESPDGKRVDKMVVRGKYDVSRDIVMAIMPANGFVKTVWFNLRSDRHGTLDASKYNLPGEARA